MGAPEERERVCAWMGVCVREKKVQCVVAQIKDRESVYRDKEREGVRKNERVAKR